MRLVAAMMEVHSMLPHRSILRVEGLAAVFRGEALHKLRIRMEFFFAAMQLARAA